MKIIKMKKQLISLVIPIFNEQDSLNELYQQIVKTFRTDLKNFAYELILINDGSSDSSLEIIKQLAKTNPQILIISFRRNIGKATALDRGFQKAKGDLVVTMDADLQDGPENLQLMINQLNQGYDLVVGWKKQRYDPLNKTLPSRLFNFVVGRSAKIPLHDFNSGLKLMRRSVAKEIYLYGELHRFIPVLAAQRGFRVTEVAVTHHKRKYGRSKYGWSRLVRGFFDFLTIMFLGKFGSRPFHLFGLWGGISFIIGTVCLIYLTILHFSGISIYRRPLLTISVLLVVAGLQLLSIGLIAEMVIDRSNKENSLPIDYETR